MGDAAFELSQQLAAAVEHAAARVVGVLGRRRGPSSGVVWDDGLVVTAHHVLEWDEGIEVTLADGATAGATLVGRDPTTDVALLRVAAAGLAPAHWADAPPRVGHLALGLSRARGLRAGQGIVTAVGGPWRTAAGGLIDRLVETDVGPYPGFSGGLLIDTAGAGLGLNTAGLLRGAGVAVPPATLQRVVAALLEHGQVRRGFLGVGTMPVRLEAAASAAAGQAGGLMITSVQPGGPAEQAGVLLGDVLLAFDGHATTSPRDLVARLDHDRVGHPATLRFLRAGQPLELDVTVGSRDRSAS